MKTISILTLLAFWSLIPLSAQQRVNEVGGVWSWQAVPKYEEYNDFPSGGKNAWKEESHDAQRRGLLEFIKQIRGAEPSTVKAFPSAKDFPGIPEDGTPLISRTLTVNPEVHGWQSTGLYALPGVKVTVKVPKNIQFKKDNKNYNFGVRIGCHTDSLGLGRRHKSWSRTPQLSYATDIKGAITEITSPSGGLIYITCNPATDLKQKPFTAEISPAAKAPVYVLGKTSTIDWKRQLEQTSVPWGEIVTPRVVTSLSLSTLRKIEDMPNTAEHLLKGMKAQDWLAAWDYAPNELKRPMRFVVDRQISAGGGHSGYPTMGLSYWAKHFETGNVLKTGHWGLWHELGHNHQRNPLSLGGMGETTVNFYTLAAHIAATETTPEQAFSINPKQKSQILDFMATKEAFDSSATDHGMRLEFFKGMFKFFGFEPLRNISIKYYKTPYNPKELNNQQKWDWFFISMCDEVKRDMSPYFDLWKVNISDEAKQQASKYKPWLPSRGYPQDYYKP